MTWKTTQEQNAIIEWRGNQLVVNAFAGTGKTTTLVQFARANPGSKMLYLAYNRAIRDEAEQKFPFNVECKTSHQLAWSHFGRHFRHRLTANLRITYVARKLNTRHWPLPGLQAPRSAPAACRKKAKEQLRRFRRGERNYRILHVRGKCAPGQGWLKIDIGVSWRLLSRNSGADWELLTHERYNNELRK